MSSKPSGKKRVRQAEFLASYVAPRTCPRPNTITRINFNEDGLQTEECPLPVPMSSAPPTFKLLEPLRLGSDPIDNLSDGEEDSNEEEKVEEKVEGDKTTTTQVRLVLP